MPTDRWSGLVDTDIVILRDRLAATELPDTIAISAVTLVELSAGPHAVVGDDAPAARVYGQLTGAVRAFGRTPRRRHADPEPRCLGAP